MHWLIQVIYCIVHTYIILAMHRESGIQSAFATASRSSLWQRCKVGNCLVVGEEPGVPEREQKLFSPKSGAFQKKKKKARSLLCALRAILHLSAQQISVPSVKQKGTLPRDLILRTSNFTSARYLVCSAKEGRDLIPYDNYSSVGVRSLADMLSGRGRQFIVVHSPMNQILQ